MRYGVLAGFYSIYCFFMQPIVHVMMFIMYLIIAIKDKDFNATIFILFLISVVMNVLFFIYFISNDLNVLVV